MNYDLVKELKDAGFPQKDRGNFVSPPDIEIVNSPLAIYVPTLSELIEACTSNQGGNFALHQNRREDEKQWCAWTINSSRSNPTAYDEKEYGPTPEEAVARLWLALNKK